MAYVLPDRTYFFPAFRLAQMAFCALEILALVAAVSAPGDLAIAYNQAASERHRVGFWFKVHELRWLECERKRHNVRGD